MVRLDRFLTLHLFRPLIKLRRENGRLRIPILMYHSISDDQEARVHPYYKICTSPFRFHEHMRFLKDNGYQVIPLSTALSLITDRPNRPDRLNRLDRLDRPNRPNRLDRPNYVVLTFDDGYSDFYTKAWPVISEFKFPATVFLPTAFIDYTSRSFKGRQCLTWNQVRELHEQGITFGSHTVNHVQLRDLEWSDIDREIKVSKKAIEDEIGEPVKEFSYPYAYPEADRTFCKKLSYILKENGYNLCLTTRIGQVLSDDDPLSLKRLPINNADDISLLSAKLAGAYDWLAYPQRLLKLLKNSPINSYNK